jgi:hypothetical protein
MYLKVFLLETGRFCDQTYRLEVELSLTDAESYLVLLCDFKAEVWCFS